MNCLVLFRSSSSVFIQPTWLRYNDSKQIKRASSWDYGLYHIGNQRRLKRACASAQSLQIHCCSHFAQMKYWSGRRIRPKVETSRPTWWLRMRFWRMSLWRTKSTIISWDGSNNLRAVKCKDPGDEKEHDKSCIKSEGKQLFVFWWISLGSEKMSFSSDFTCHFREN